MLRRHLFALSLLGLASIGAARAGVINFVPLTSLNVAPGGSVTFEIYGSSVNTIDSFTLILTSTGTGNQFQISDFTLNTALFVDQGLIDPLPQSFSLTEESQDFGSYVPSAPLAANTSFLLGTATVTINASTPVGSYFVSNTATSGFANLVFDDVPVTDLNLNITAVPEPATWGIILGGGLTCIALARRFRNKVRA